MRLLNARLSIPYDSTLTIRASERDLSFENLKNVVSYSDRKQTFGRGQHGGTICRFFKKVDGRTLVCVAEIKNGECWIITGYYDS